MSRPMFPFSTLVYTSRNSAPASSPKCHVLVASVMPQFHSPPQVNMYQRLPVQVLEQATPLGRTVVHDGAAPTPVATPAAVVAEMRKAWPYLFKVAEYEA